MPLPLGVQRIDCCWESQILKGEQKCSKSWLRQMNFQKLIAHPESWILIEQSQKNINVVHLWRHLKGIKSPLALCLYQKFLNNSKIKNLPKSQNLCRCFDRHMCYVNLGFIADKISWSFVHISGNQGVKTTKKGRKTCVLI